MLTTGWGKGQVREKKKNSAKQRREAKEVECPILVKYEDNFWLHDFSDNTVCLGKEDFDRLLDSKADNNELKTRQRCMVGNSQGAGDHDSDRSNEG